MKKSKNDPEELKALIDRLEKFQGWRRGIIENYDLNAKQIGKDLDEAIKILKKISKGNLDIHKWGSNNKE